MNANRMIWIGLVVWITAFAAARGDLLDDAGVGGSASVTGGFTPVPWHPQDGYEVISGIVLSEANTNALHGGLVDQSEGYRVMLLESQGKFQMALDGGNIEPLTRVRLLVRLGLVDNPGCHLSDDEVAKLYSYRGGPPYLACLPLEVDEKWDQLDQYLAILSKYLKSPRWVAAIWQEKLDVAWHRGRLEELLDAPEGILQLAFFHDVLGNSVRRDHLAMELLNGATPLQIAELLEMLPNCNIVAQASLKLWDDPSLSPEVRKMVFEWWYPRLGSDDFKTHFLKWLDGGGDAKPFIETIWAKTEGRLPVSNNLKSVIEGLLARYPDAMECNTMLAWQLVSSDPERAAELFEKVAEVAVQKSDHPGWGYSKVNPPAIDKPSDVSPDFAYLGISGLAALNLQDRVAAVLKKQSALAGLPVVDRARYLCAGDMDYDFLKEVQAADLSLAVNDSLASWVRFRFSRWLDMGDGRQIPAESIQALAGRYADLAAGTADKKMESVVDDAEGLLNGLAQAGAEGQLLKSEVAKLLTVVGNRDRKQAAALDTRLSFVARTHPRLLEIFPIADKENATSLRDFSKSKKYKFATWLSVFAKPDIRRLRPAYGGTMGRMGSGRQENNVPPIHLLNRWSTGLGNSTVFRIPELQDQDMMKLVMSQFKPGDPRRLLAEVGIATGMIKCDDEALRNAAKASYDSLMAGTTLARGTEAFRYVRKMQLGAGEEELKAILDEVELLPDVLRAAFIDSLRMSSSNGMAATLPNPAWLGHGKPQSAEGPQHTAADEREVSENARELMNLEAAGRTTGPDALAVAKRVLDASLDVELGNTTDYERQAFSMLEKSDGVDAWLHDSNERLLKSGMSEPEVCERMLKYHSFRARATTSQFVKYAIRMLELDPKNYQAAYILLEDAIERSDREMIGKYVLAMGSKGFDFLARPEVLVIYGGKNADELLKLIRRLDKKELIENVHAMEILHGFFLSNDPKLAAGFRELMSQRAKKSFEWRMGLANQLLKFGDEEGAADLIARSFIKTNTYPGFPWKFPPKIATYREVQSALDRRQAMEVLMFHHHRDFLRAIMIRLEELGGAESEIVPTFHLIVDPTAESFDKHALNVLAKMDERTRAEVTNGWKIMFARVPGTSGLLLRILEEKVQLGASSEPQRLANVIRAASDLRGSESMIQKSWSELLPFISDTKDPATAAKAAGWARELVSPMLGAANAETWKSYWRWRLTDPSAIGETGSRDQVTGTSGCSTLWRAFGWPLAWERLMDVMPRMLGEPRKGTKSNLDASWVSAALATGDEEILRAVKEGIVETPAHLEELCDLGLGDATGISPALGVIPQEEGDPLVWWSLVTLPAEDPKAILPDVPVGVFSKLDNRFDAQILAGPRQDRLSLVKEIPLISASGHVRLKLNANQRFILMQVTEKATGIVRWTKVTEIRDPTGASITIPEDRLIGEGFSKDENVAPGGLSAWRIFLPAGDRHDLLDIPWSGSESISAEAWVTGGGYFTLRYMNAANDEVGSIRMSSRNTMVPAWTFQTVVTVAPDRVPPATVRMVLSVDGEGPRSFGFAGFRLTVTDPLALPEGFERVGRIPGKFNGLLASPDGGMLAMTREDGLVFVMNVRDGNFETIDTGYLSGQEEDPEATFKLLWNDAGFHAISRNGWVRKINVDLLKCEKVFNIREELSQWARMSMAMTADGKWLVWREAPAQLKLISMDGRVKRDITVADIAGFEVLEEGISIQTSAAARVFLKAGDFETGEPQKVPDETAQVQDLDPRLAIRYNHAAARGGNPPLSIPASPERSVVTKDGVLYYITDSGAVVRVR